MKTIPIHPGTHIVQACADACETATRIREGVRFVFNDVEVKAFPDNHPDMLLDQYFDNMEKTVSVTQQ